MLSKSKNRLSRHYWHRIQHSACGFITTEKVWMGHHHDLYAHKKVPDALERSLADVISPDVMSQVFMMKTPE